MLLLTHWDWCYCTWPPDTALYPSSCAWRNPRRRHSMPFHFPPCCHCHCHRRRCCCCCDAADWRRPAGCYSANSLTNCAPACAWRWLLPMPMLLCPQLGHWADSGAGYVAVAAGWVRHHRRWHRETMTRRAWRCEIYFKNITTKNGKGLVMLKRTFSGFCISDISLVYLLK